jgi:hypothetical protein
MYTVRLFSVVWFVVSSFDCSRCVVYVSFWPREQSLGPTAGISTCCSRSQAITSPTRDPTAASEADFFTPSGAATPSPWPSKFRRAARTHTSMSALTSQAGGKRSKKPLWQTIKGNDDDNNDNNDNNNKDTYNNINNPIRNTTSAPTTTTTTTTTRRRRRTASPTIDAPFAALSALGVSTVKVTNDNNTLTINKVTS